MTSPLAPSAFNKTLEPTSIIESFLPGPVTWGKSPAQAVYHAVVLEEVAKMSLYTVQIAPDCPPAPQHIQDKHFMRKHGPNAYYGQKG